MSIGSLIQETCMNTYDSCEVVIPNKMNAMFDQSQKPEDLVFDIYNITRMNVTDNKLIEYKNIFAYNTVLHGMSMLIVYNEFYIPLETYLNKSKVSYTKIDKSKKEGPLESYIEEFVNLFS